MTEQPALPPAGFVAIIRFEVLGEAAYYAACGCGPWRCHRQPHVKEETAVRCAQRHTCKEPR